MYEFRVFFWGLICHVDEGGIGGKSHYAALVKTPDDTHEAGIVFQEKGDEYVLESDVEFIGSDDQPARDIARIDHSTFDVYVPKLRSIVRGQPNITNRVALRCYYPEDDAGSPVLSVVDAFGWTADHRLKNRTLKRSRQPVGRIIELLVKTEMPQVKVRFKTGGNLVEREVPSDGCLLIKNVEPPHFARAAEELEKIADVLLNLSQQKLEEEPSHTIAKHFQAAARSIRGGAAGANGLANHFEHYSRLLANADRAVAEEYEYVGKPNLNFPEGCKWVLKHVNHHGIIITGGVKPECGNTTFP